MKAVLDIAEVDRRLGIPDLARVCEGQGGLVRIEVTSPLCRGEMYLHGAQITSWRPAGWDEVLFLSTKSRWEEGQAIRGGIPVCFPWFRGKADDPHAPAHGIVRTRSWHLESIVQNSGGLTVSMSIENDEQTRRWWPAEFRLLHRVTFGAELKMELVCNNTGRTNLRFEEALHTYNRVADVAHVQLLGLDAVEFLDNTASNSAKVQHGGLRLTSETDNAYLTGNAVDLVDPAMHRRIQLKKTNSLSTVVWNPWLEGSMRLKDLSAGEWSQFLCVEASNILTESVELTPGSEHTMNAILSLEKL